MVNLAALAPSSGLLLTDRLRLKFGSSVLHKSWSFDPIREGKPISHLETTLPRWLLGHYRLLLVRGVLRETKLVAA